MVPWSIGKLSVVKLDQRDNVLLSASLDIIMDEAGHKISRIDTP